MDVILVISDFKIDKTLGSSFKNSSSKNNKEECPSGVSPVGVSNDGCDIYIHKNSGVQYVLRDGKQFDLSGKPLNDAGYPIIDFKLSKHNL